MSINDSPFKRNASVSSGGAIYVRTTTAETRELTLTIDGSEFTGNVAAAGGAIAVEEGTMVVESSRFTGNQASAGEGGAIAAAGTVTVVRSQFEKNHATATGGAISFIGETAPKGGRRHLSGNTSDDGEPDVAGAPLQSMTGKAPALVVTRESGPDDDRTIPAIIAAVLLAMIATAVARARTRGRSATP